MKKGIILTLYMLFIIGTIVTLFIVYKEIDSSFSYHFIIVYVIFLVLFFFYLIFLSFVNLKKLKWREIRKIVYQFLLYFVLLSGLNYLVNYWFKSSEMDFYRILSVPFGVSIGIMFSPFIFFKKGKAKMLK